MTSQRIAKLAVPMIVGIVSLAIMLPVMADRNSDRETQNVDVAKRKVALIQQGQLNLMDATKLAEKHSKGTALSGGCEIQSSEPTATEEAPGGQAADAKQAENERLIYNITCLTKDQEEVQPVLIDGLTKKVVENSQPTTPK